MNSVFLPLYSVVTSCITVFRLSDLVPALNVIAPLPYMRMGGWKGVFTPLLQTLLYNTPPSILKKLSNKNGIKNETFRVIDPVSPVM